LPESFPNRPSAVESGSSDRIARFGPFELNLTTSELRRQGRIVSMRQQSLRILIYLIEHAGTIVGREELQAAIWPSGVFIEFESGLYTAVNQMRHALGDSASQPYFVETIPKVGYRFISPVQMDLPAIQVAAAEMSPPVVEPPSAAIPAETSTRARPWQSGRLWAVILVMSMAGGWALWNHVRSSPPVLDHLHPFTTGRGSQDHASFSPDGEMLAFDWKSDKDAHTCIYVQRLDATTPVRISKGEDMERRPVWSPDGRQVAFLRDTGGPTLAIVSVALIGAEERKRAEFQKGATPWFDWSPDGRWFVVAEPAAPEHGAAVVLISAATGERHALTNPPAGWRGDSLPLFSPDSSHIAFRRTMVASGVEDLYEVPTAGGEPKRLTFENRTLSAFSFTPDAGVLFSAKWNSSIRTLWWMGPHGGRLIRMTAPAFDATAPAVSRDGKHLAFSKVLYDVNIWRLNTDGASPATPLIDSRLPDTGAQYSPDGRRIVFQSVRSGSDEIWVCDSQGANAVRLVDGHGIALGNPKWSGDGRHIAFEWQPSGKSEIYVVAADGGAPRKLVADANQNSMPSWSHDARFVYFSSNRSGHRAIWKVPVEGGAAIPVISQASLAPVESPDGQYLYYFRDDREDGEVWRVRIRIGVPAGPESQVLTGLRPHDWGNWAPGDNGIYYIRQLQNGSAAVEYRAFSNQAVRTVYALRQPPIWASAGLALSPDGKTILFAQVDQDDSNIFIQ
jgi:Tol biopolymer transport system component/DNA-binding winged helix-turn-helix (wHTH) protein